jgi:hypothetical protein
MHPKRVVFTPDEFPGNRRGPRMNAEEAFTENR